MSQHTKGNWYLQEYTDAYTNIIRCNNEEGFEGLFIGYTPQDTSPENRANAKLMAAAPDLLEALSALVELRKYKDINGKDVNYSKLQPKLWRDAQAAIAKAVG